VRDAKGFVEVARILAARGVIHGYSLATRRVYVDDEKKVKFVRQALQEGGYEFEVVVLPRFFALSQPPSRTGVVRPLKSGVSVGHRDITAGTLSGLAEKGEELYILSNAHVFHPWPLSPNPPYNKSVWQPGPYDAGYDFANEKRYAVADYAYHVRIRSMYDYSECPITKTINWMYKVLGRNSFVVTQVQNYVDAAIAKLYGGVGFEMSTFAVESGEAPRELLDKPFVGLVFAGTQMGHGAICKLAKYWDKYFNGYRILFPKYEGAVDVGAGDVVAKDGRTSGFTAASVIDPAASLAVGYYYDIAWFEDVILTSADLKVAGGDSGSPAWLWKRAE